MNARMIEVLVMENAEIIQRWPCTPTTLPDGVPGVIWRGVAYPLLAGDRIDIGAAPSSPLHRHLVLSGADASWILIAGLPATLAALRHALEAAGVEVLRIGRWMGDAEGGVAYDWFIHCAGALDPAEIGAVLGQPDSPPTPDPALRAGVLEQRLAELHADLARLRSSLHAQQSIASSVAIETPAADPALAAALETIAALQEALQQSAPIPVAIPPAALHLRDEIVALVEGLRPDIRFLRSSLLVVIGEFQSRTAFWRAVAELNPSGARPGGWKALRGVDRWWERHVSSGRDDNGRLYARFDVTARRWDLLLGWKADQTHDIAWLQRQ